MKLNKPRFPANKHKCTIILVFPHFTRTTSFKRLFRDGKRKVPRALDHPFEFLPIETGLQQDHSCSPHTGGRYLFDGEGRADDCAKFRKTLIAITKAHVAPVADRIIIPRRSRGFFICGQSPRILAAPSQAHRRSGICVGLLLTARQNGPFRYLPGFNDSSAHRSSIPPTVMLSDFAMNFLSS